MHQIRVYLGLEAQPSSGDLGEVPPDLDQTFSSVREAQAALVPTAARLGVVRSYVQLPKQMIEQFENLDQGDVDRTLAGLTANAPAVKQAQAKLDVATANGCVVAAACRHQLSREQSVDCKKSRHNDKFSTAFDFTD